MIFARVAGTVVSTKKNDSIIGTKYLLTRTCDQNGKPKNDYIVALDLVGAGTGEVVIIAQGSSSRQTELTYQKPIDAKTGERNQAGCRRRSRFRSQSAGKRRVFIPHPFIRSHAHRAEGRQGSAGAVSHGHITRPQDTAHLHRGVSGGNH